MTTATSTLVFGEEDRLPARYSKPSTVMILWEFTLLLLVVLGIGTTLGVYSAGVLGYTIDQAISVLAAAYYAGIMLLMLVYLVTDIRSDHSTYQNAVRLAAKENTVSSPKILARTTRERFARDVAAHPAHANYVRAANAAKQAAAARERARAIQTEIRDAVKEPTS